MSWQIVMTLVACLVTILSCFIGSTLVTLFCGLGSALVVGALHGTGSALLFLIFVCLPAMIAQVLGTPVSKRRNDPMLNLLTAPEGVLIQHVHIDDKHSIRGHGRIVAMLPNGDRAILAFAEHADDRLLEQYGRKLTLEARVIVASEIARGSECAKLLDYLALGVVNPFNKEDKAWFERTHRRKIAHTLYDPDPARAYRRLHGGRDIDRQLAAMVIEYSEKVTAIAAGQAAIVEAARKIEAAALGEVYEFRSVMPKDATVQAGEGVVPPLVEGTITEQAATEETPTLIPVAA